MLQVHSFQSGQEASGVMPALWLVTSLLFQKLEPLWTAGKLVPPLWKTGGLPLHTLAVSICQDPSILLLSIQQTEMNTYVQSLYKDVLNNLIIYNSPKSKTTQLIKSSIN